MHLVPNHEALGLSERISPRTAVAVIWLQRVVVSLGIAFALSTFIRHPGYNVFWDGVVYLSMGVGCVALAFMRALLVKSNERRTWAVFALSLACSSAGGIAESIYRAFNWNISDISILDVFFLGACVFIYISVILLMRARLRHVPRSVWLDGAVAAFTCGAVALAMELGTIITNIPGGGWLYQTVSVAYPVSDVISLVLVVGCFSLSRWRPDRSWLFVGLGMVCLAIPDTINMFSSSYTPGTPLDIGWTASWVFLGLAPWRKARRVNETASDRWTIVAMPVVFALVSLSILVVGTERHLPRTAIALAVIAVLGALVRLGLTFNEIRALSESRREARTDELTDLGNRRYFYERAGSMLLGRSDDHPMALLVVDLDRFKEINDSLGHQIGDNLLRQLGPRLTDAIRKDDVIARLGGDEFAVVIDGADEGRALEVAATILRAIDEPFYLDDVPIRISASVGIALFPQHASEPNGLLQHADVAMYRAKREHSGSQVYLPDSDLNTKERLRSIHELRRALEADRLVVFYQPQVDAKTGGLVGAEALVRLNHPTRGIIPPDLFLPLAEQAGLMRLLTMQVFEKVLDDQVRWREAGSAPISVAVNLSVTNLLDVGFPEYAKQAMADRNLDPKHIVFEVTEGTMLQDLDQACEAAANLRALGSEISLDDYGTGFASLAYLRKFPLNELKLDRSFVSDLETDEVARTFVRSTIDIAHALGLRVVAEGIETDEMWKSVAATGANVCQGYYFSRPLPADVFFDQVVMSESRTGDQAVL